MLTRSILFIPANSPKMMLYSNYMDADIIIFDLEDGVSPEHKLEARELLRAYLSSGHVNCTCFIRVNSVHSPEFEEDINALQGAKFDGLYLPKVEYPEDVLIAEKALETIEGSIGVPIGTRSIINTVETPMGLENALPCILASPRVYGVCLGSEDYAASLGLKRSDDYTEIDYARRRLVNIAKAAERTAIDTVFADVNDIESLKEQTLYGKRLGYDGKAALSPAQVRQINAIYSPSESEIKHAHDVIDALNNAKQSASGIAVFNGKMIDAPVAKQAQNVLMIAERIYGNGAL